MNDDTELLGRRYRIEEECEADGYTYYFATDTSRRDRPVSIKTASKAVVENENAISQFIQEVKLQEDLQHPSIVKVLHFYQRGEIDSRCHLVTEWIETTLDESLTSGVISVEKSMGIIQKIIQGLKVVHENGFVHRGIEPKNILLTSNFSTVKIGDFRYSVKIEDNQILSGKPRYEAPESYSNDSKIDQRADIYSLGFVCYEMLLGRDAFHAQFQDIFEETDSTLQADRWLNWHLDPERKLLPLASFDTGIDDRLSRVVAKMVEKNPVDRYRDLQEVVGAFSTAVQGIGWREEIKPIETDDIKPIDIDDNSDPSTSKNPKRSKALLYGGGALLLSILLVVVYLVTIPELTYQDVDPKYAEMEELKVTAIDAGAERLSLNSFTEASALAITAQSAYEDGSLNVSMKSIKGAIKLYKEAAEEAVQSQLAYGQELSNRIKVFRIDSSDESVGKATNQLNELSSASQLTDMKLVGEKLKAMVQGFERAIKTLPRSFFMGSTQEEITAATDLCKAHVSLCKKSWYESEEGIDVKVSPFSIDKNEITNKEFGEFVLKTGHQTTAEVTGYGLIWYGTVPRKARHAFWMGEAGGHIVAMEKPNNPVVYVSYDDALAYCKWSGKRVPTKVEWEYAARGVERNQFPWGNEWDESQLLGYKEASTNQNKPVGSYKPANSGSKGFDFSGSVWEWVWDTSAKKAILKGGSFRENNPANFRLAAERYTPPVNTAHNDDGFRCASDADEWPEVMQITNM